MRYREVLFRPKLASSWSIPIAALTADDAGHVEVVVAPLLPHAECLGDVRAFGLMNDFLGRLLRAPAFDAIEHVGSRAFALGPVRDLPAVPNGRAWIEANVLPSHAGEARRRSPTYQRRATHGWSFLRHVGLDRYVRKGFTPSTPGERQPLSLPTIAHYVPGEKAVLLLEPLFDRAREDHARQIADIAGYFSQYLWLNTHRRGDFPEFKCAAYAINSGALATAAAELLGERATVYDVTTAVGTHAFSSVIEQAAGTAVA